MTNVVKKTMFGGLFGRCTGPPGPVNRTSDAGNCGPFSALLLLAAYSSSLLLAPVACPLEFSWFGKLDGLCSVMKHPWMNQGNLMMQFVVLPILMTLLVFPSVFPCFSIILAGVFIDKWSGFGGFDGKIHVLVKFWWKVKVFGTIRVLV